MKAWMLGEGGATGLITYMRTDSTNVSEWRQKKCASLFWIPTATISARNTAAVPTRAVGAQEAHEAIRPTSVLRLPEKLRPT
jgi:DNA topoisomerase I